MERARSAPRCRRCWQHGLSCERRGHVCTYADCTCPQCERIARLYAAARKRRSAASEAGSSQHTATATATAPAPVTQDKKDMICVPVVTLDSGGDAPAAAPCLEYLFTPPAAVQSKPNKKRPLIRPKTPAAMRAAESRAAAMRGARAAAAKATAEAVTLALAPTKAKPRLLKPKAPTRTTVVMRWTNCGEVHCRLCRLHGKKSRHRRGDCPLNGCACTARCRALQAKDKWLAALAQQSQQPQRVSPDTGDAAGPGTSRQEPGPSSEETSPSLPPGSPLPRPPSVELVDVSPAPPLVVDLDLEPDPEPDPKSVPKPDLAPVPEPRTLFPCPAHPSCAPLFNSEEDALDHVDTVHMQLVPLRRLEQLFNMIKLASQSTEILPEESLEEQMPCTLVN